MFMINVLQKLLITVESLVVKALDFISLKGYFRGLDFTYGQLFILTWSIIEYPGYLGNIG